ncbi:endonuclease/exonuclease/phosphatase family protein [Streptomyces sp. GESEQ-4]|uniref:endonuclease/exonuclease/phosphatase family protein n=1 Tax=Streptomyces sp. GESEQ-4 TaxID=2812655 RepID=UPI001FF0C06D|nr:endonuclease/exonuclease/phosphatase family protein [Streptomyces sp. GESEQ-4]
MKRALVGAFAAVSLAATGLAVTSSGTVSAQETGNLQTSASTTTAGHAQSAAAPTETQVPREGQAQAQAPFANRVVTFNVKNPDRRPFPGPHMQRIIDQIREYRPQVIALQEICANDARIIRDNLRAYYGLSYNLAQGDVMNNFGRCWPGRGYGTALLSAAPLTNMVKHVYGAGGTEPRGYVAADTTVAGKNVRVFVTHLAQAGQSDVRQQQVQELLADALTFPDTIVMGDFNAEPNTREVTPMWTWYKDADPACSAAQPDPPCQWTADASPHRKKFDYIFLRNGSFTAPSAGVHDNYSDHDLVHADLSVG